MLVRLGLQGSLAPCLRCRVRVVKRLLIRLVPVDAAQEECLVRVWVRLCVTDLLDLLVTLILSYLYLLDQMMMMNAL